jgi:hypothetical protein
MMAVDHPAALTPLLFPPCKSDWLQALLLCILNIPFDLGSLLFHSNSSAAVYHNIKAFNILFDILKSFQEWTLEQPQMKKYFLTCTENVRATKRSSSQFEIVYKFMLIVKWPECIGMSLREFCKSFPFLAPSLYSKRQHGKTLRKEKGFRDLYLFSYQTDKRA